MNTGRLVGIILIVIGFGIAIIAGLWLAVQAQQVGAGGILIGAGIAFIPVAILVGAGIYLVVIGGREALEESEMQQQRQLLDIVKSHGEVAVSDLALEMKVSADKVRSLIHQLVGLQVFSGYVNWEKGVIYSSDAGSLRGLQQCKNCNGDIQLVGKGVVTCKFCGTEYFLS
ncbi:MAG: hypothetical protein JNJ61_12650 [Anaerolineae bacterium]|nr:hypothetical protein [Anaerolineae bacterium]